MEVGLLAGTAAVAAQNLVDFSLEFAGVGVPFMVALGLLTRGEGAVRLRWRWLAAGTAAACGLALAGALLWRAHPTDEEAAAVARAPTAAEAARLASEAQRWHRADYLPAAAVGARYVQEDRCAAAMPWLTRAMALNPTAPEPHQYAARCLAAARQDALARREYRLAVLYGSPGALAEAADRYQAVEELLQVAPDTGDGLMGSATCCSPASARPTPRWPSGARSTARSTPGRWCRWPGRCWPPASWRRRWSTPSAAPARPPPTRRAGGWPPRCCWPRGTTTRPGPRWSRGWR